MTGGDPLRQDLGDVLRAAVGEVLDLLPAGDAGQADGRGRGRRRNRREEPFLADLARDVVMLGFIAEGASHPTAAGATLSGGATRACEHSHRGAYANERLLVAVAVEQD